MSERTDTPATLTPEEALAAINELRSNVVATQNAGWSNLMYPLVAILNAAGCEQFRSTEEQMAEHFNCYGGAGGYPGKLHGVPSGGLSVQPTTTGTGEVSS